MDSSEVSYDGGQSWQINVTYQWLTDDEDWVEAQQRYIEIDFPAFLTAAGYVVTEQIGQFVSAHLADDAAAQLDVNEFGPDEVLVSFRHRP